MKSKGLQNPFNRPSTAGEETGKVSSVIDFGDMVHTCTVCNLAVAAAYAMLDKPDPLAAAAHVVAGYHQVFPLTEQELALLYPLICARLCISVVNSAYQQQVEPAFLVLGVGGRRLLVAGTGSRHVTRLAECLRRGWIAVSVRPGRGGHPAANRRVAADLRRSRAGIPTLSTARYWAANSAGPVHGSGTGARRCLALVRSVETNHLVVNH